MQVLCARYSDEEFFRVRCKGKSSLLFNFNSFPIKIDIKQKYKCS